MTVYKSMANGRSQRVDAATVDSGAGGDARETFDFDLTLTPFVDGGWYWYDVVAGDEDAVVESAEWTAEVPADREQHGTVDIVITTVNKPDFCAKLLTQIGEDETLRPYLDTVFVSEQGTQKVADHELFPLAEKALGDLLVINEQGNLGGSGGYARGQLESRPQGHRDLRDDDGRRRRLRAREHRAGHHLRRPGPPADDRRRPHVLALLALAPALVRRDRAAVAVLVADAARRLLRLGPRRPQHPLRRGGCTSASTSTSTAGSCA